jgi:hypothetical protein
MSAACRISQTVDVPIGCPSRVSSPRICLCPRLCVLSSELQDQLLERRSDRWASCAGAPGAVVPLRRDQPAMPGQQRARREREDLAPAATGYQVGEGGQQEPVRGRVADRAGDLTGVAPHSHGGGQATRRPWCCRDSTAPRGRTGSLEATLYSSETITPAWFQYRPRDGRDLQR